MKKYVEICGTPIEIKSIKSYRIVQKEYIFRPVFRELPPKNIFSSVRYLFETMEPYAAIYDEKQVGIISKVKKYQCENAAGRKMTISLDEVPVLVHMDDGHSAEVFKDNPNYKLMGKDKSACIEMIEALVIQAKETYTFYGRNIHLYSVLDAYAKVKDAIESYNQKKPKNEKVTAEAEIYEDDVTVVDRNSAANNDEVRVGAEKPKSIAEAGEYAKNIIGKVKKSVDTVKTSFGDIVDSIKDIKNFDTESDKGETVVTADKTGDELKLLKSRYESGEITEEEFNQEVNKLLDNL